MSLDNDTRVAIVRYAEAFIGTSHDELDCSHFVWRVFKRFVPRLPYLSTDAFLGSQFFEPLSDPPRPPDLVLWEGHVAILVNPEAGSFIGSQSSTGVAIATFQNPYWHERHPIAYLGLV
jgi:cell wall-associated NlpC family hydrolase